VARQEGELAPPGDARLLPFGECHGLVHRKRGIEEQAGGGEGAGVGSWVAPVLCAAAHRVPLLAAQAPPPGQLMAQGERIQQ